MPRQLKQFLYGTLYLGIIFLFGLWIFRGVTAQPISCIDGTKNGGETGIDCGGSCVSCALKNLSPLKTEARVRLFNLPSGAVSVVGEITNTNFSANASAHYIFDLYNETGTFLNSLSGSVFVPASKKVMVYEGGVQTQPVARATLRLESPTWEDAAFHPLGTAPRVEGVTTTISEGRMRIEGFLRNETPNTLSRAQVITLLSDSSLNELFAGGTFVDNLTPFSSTPFTILFPSDTLFARDVDAQNTRVLVSVQ